MLRGPLLRAIVLAKPSKASISILDARSNSSATPMKAPEKIEVFVDDQPVMVDPGTTVLQVNQNKLYQHISLFKFVSSKIGCSNGWC